MPFDPRRAKELFHAALDLPDPADRPAFLDRECGDDRELRERLDELLAAHDRPAEALERPLAAPPEAATDPDGLTRGPSSDPDRTVSVQPEAAPTAPLLDRLIAGRYKLRQEIGEGGMGTVFLAEQIQPVRRQVALKLIKAGMDTRTVLARFESERQALALMDHPNIAKVLDAGSTDEGRPFFVMELVKGVPLTDYCDRNRLDLPERLGLFRQICSAVQHAHQKGIIHRDLKPTNILVESHDGKPVPKVIDFGLAKAVSGMQLGEHSLYSAFDGVAGTPLYMAPEQATFNAVDVDTRADVYALGVILYELLSGSTPIQRDTFRRAALDEMMRVIREVEPPTPSSRISGSDLLASLAAARDIEPARLGRFLRGDLDWIVMKALSKERQRRYESPIAFARDIERFTNHEPVSAGPPSTIYRFKKFVRRNRPQVVAASLVLLALVGGIVGTTIGLIEANHQKRIAVASALAEAEQRRQAEKRLAQIEKANEILGSIFKDIDPKRAEMSGKPLAALLGERLDQATAQIEGDAIGDPLTVARMQRTLAESQLGLGYAVKAIGLYAKSRRTLTTKLGPDHPETLAGMNDLAAAYQEAGRGEQALALLKETLALRQAKLGHDHPDTLASMNNLAEGYRNVGKLDRAIPLFERTLALKKMKLGAGHIETIATMNNLALAYQAAGRLDRAVPLFEETLRHMAARLGPEHPNTLTLRNNLANSHLAAGNLDRAIPLYEETLKIAVVRLGPEHPDTLRFMHNLAEGYRNAGKPDRALPILERTLALKKSKLGPDHPETIATMNGLALVYQAVGDLERALPMFEETLRRMASKVGSEHPDVLTVMNNLAIAYQAAGDLERALSMFEETLRRMVPTLGKDHPATLNCMNNLAGCYQAAGKIDRAVTLFEETFALKKVKLGLDHPETIATMNNLALAYQAAGKLDQAMPLFKESLGFMTAKLGPGHPSTLTVMNNLASCYQSAGKFDRALPLLTQLSEYRKSKDGADSPSYAGALAAIGLNLVQQEKWTEAEALLREALKIRETKEPDAWTTFNTKSLLGAALLGRKESAGAEPLLRAGYGGMKARADQIPPQAKVRLAEALDRLIALAEATGKADEAKAWKDERTKLPATPAPKAASEEK